MGMTPVTTAWLAELIVITYRGGKQASIQRPVPNLPLPAEYAATFVIYGALSMVPEGPWGNVAAVFGWGIVVATFLNLWNPSSIGQNGGPAVKQVSSQNVRTV